MKFKNISLSGAQTHESTIFKADIEKKFIRFLVQMETAEVSFDINLPLIQYILKVLLPVLPKSRE